MLSNAWKRDGAEHRRQRCSRSENFPGWCRFRFPPCGITIRWEPKPVLVDDATGYRYYSAGQLPQLHRILALKGLGFDLAQIAAVLAEGITPEQMRGMRGMLRLSHAQIRQQLAEAQSRMKEVEVRLQQIEREEQLSSYDVILKRVEPQLVASVRAILPTYSASGSLFPEVYEALGPYARQALGPHPTDPTW